MVGDCIVDACVLKGAGTSDVIDSIRCRGAIDAVRVHKHVLLVDPKLWDEWRVHLTRYSASWLTDIISREQLVFVTLSDRHRHGLTAAIYTLPVAQQPAALKDLHILQAAVEHNALVISNEQVCRRAYVSCGSSYPPIQGVYWVSPLMCADLPHWLAQRGPPNAGWLLI